MARSLPNTARRFGLVAALALLAVNVVYAVVLGIGMLRLPSPDTPIQGPVFVALELLILAIGPLLVAVSVAIHVWAETEVHVYSLCGVVGMSLTALLTSSVHFVILTIGHHDRMTAWPALPLLLSFTWPSVTYTVDILAWDVCFPLGALALAMVFRGAGLHRWIRWLLMASAGFAFAGLSGVVLNDMAWRNLGIVGYAVVFPVAVGAIAWLFWHEAGAAA